MSNLGKYLSFLLVPCLCKTPFRIKVSSSSISFESQAPITPMMNYTAKLPPNCSPTDQIHETKQRLLLSSRSSSLSWKYRYLRGFKKKSFNFFCSAYGHDTQPRRNPPQTANWWVHTVHLFPSAKPKIASVGFRSFAVSVPIQIKIRSLSSGARCPLDPLLGPGFFGCTSSVPPRT